MVPDFTLDDPTEEEENLPECPVLYRDATGWDLVDTDVVYPEYVS